MLPYKFFYKKGNISYLQSSSSSFQYYYYYYYFDLLGGEYFGTFNEKNTKVDDGSASNDIDEDVNDHN